MFLSALSIVVFLRIMIPTVCRLWIFSNAHTFSFSSLTSSLVLCIVKQWFHSYHSNDGITIAIRMSLVLVMVVGCLIEVTLFKSSYRIIIMNHGKLIKLTWHIHYQLYNLGNEIKSCYSVGTLLYLDSGVYHTIENLSGGLPKSVHRFCLKCLRSFVFLVVGLCFYFFNLILQLNSWPFLIITVIIR